MIILAIDTSANLCAVCLWDTEYERCLSTKSLELSRGHAEHLMPLIAEVLAYASIQLTAVDKVAVSVGPGSFTGIRVGTSVARGFGVALGMPVVGITTFDAIAAEAQKQLSANKPYAVILNGGRSQVFIQKYHVNGTCDGEPQIGILDEEDIASLLQGSATLLGNAANLVDPSRTDKDFECGTATIETYAMLGATATDGATPIYVRSADAKIQQGFALPRTELNPL